MFTKDSLGRKCIRVALSISIALVSTLATFGNAKAHLIYDFEKISSTDGNFSGALDDWDRFGHAVSSIGDLDGDGVNDMAVGAFSDDDGGADRGAVYVLFLNTDGSVKSHQKISDTAGGFSGTLDDGDNFGYTLGALGDLDGDGIQDLAVGAIWDDDGGPARGAVYVLFLNTDGSVKSHQKISDTAGGFTASLDDWDTFGHAIENIGDLDGDGVLDLVVGAGWDDDGGDNRGAVYVLFMNTNGTVKSYQKISNTTGGFGAILEDHDKFGTYAVTSLGDIDGDSVVDIAVGAFGDDDGGTDRGAVYVLFLNIDGSVKSHQKISSLFGNLPDELDDNDAFGAALESIADRDSDGIPELLVGAPLDDDGGSNRGAVYALFLNNDGTVKSFQKISSERGLANLFGIQIDNNDNFGSDVANLGDLDGDGIEDIAVGADDDDDGGLNRGAVWVLFMEWSSGDKHLVVGTRGEGGVGGLGWDPGSEVTMTIDDPLNGPGVDLTDTQIVQGNSNIDSLVGFNTEGFELRPGQFVTLNDGIDTASLTIKSIVVTQANPFTDEIFGTAEPFSEVEVGTENPCCNMITTEADVNGDWSVDFSTIGVDLVLGSRGAGFQQDYEVDDGHTRYNWSLDQRVEASTESDWIQLHEFTPNSTAQIEIYDDSDELVVDDVVEINEDWFGMFEGGIDLQPGWFIRATDTVNSVVKELVIQNLAIESGDPVLDVIEGYAPPSVGVVVEVGDETGDSRIETQAGLDGHWVADFSGVFDITENTSVQAFHLDEDNDRTVAHFGFGEQPSIAGSLTSDWINLERFAADAEVSIDIDGSPFSVTTDGDGNGWLDGGETSIDLVVGTTITATQGDTAKELTLEDINLDVFDLENDLVEGTTLADAWLFVNVHDELIDDGYGMNVQAGSDGYWTADFGADSVDLHKDMHAQAMLFDDDGDATVAELPEPPSIQGNLTHNWISLERFAVDAEVSIDIDGSPFSVTTDGDGYSWLDNTDIDPVVLVVGTTITATQGNIVKELTLVDISLDEFNVETELIKGTAPAEAWLFVNVHDELIGEGYGMDVQADSDGNWTADLGIDLHEDMCAQAMLFDDDKDATVAELPEPPEPPRIEGALVHNWINLMGFTANTQVSIDIDGSSLSVTTDEGGNRWINRSEHGVDLIVGTTITATEGDTVKVLTLADIAIESVDYDANIVIGHAPAGLEFEVNVWDENTETGFGMQVVAESGDTWTADFGEEDITEEMWVGAYHLDEDKDATVAELPIELRQPFIVAITDREQVFAAFWPMGETVDLCLDYGPAPDGICDHTATETIYEAPWGWPIAYFELDGIHDLAADDVVVVSGLVDEEPISKTLVVTYLEVTDVDIDTDTVSGYADVDRKIRVFSSGVDFEVGSDGLTGYWSAYVGDLLDIIPGTGGNVVDEMDEDGDYTEVWWYANEAPAVDAGGPYETNENNPITLMPVVSDADGDELTFAWSYEIDEGECAFSDPGAVNTSFTCQDDGEFTLILTVSDGVNEPVSASAPASIANADPDMGAISAPIDPIEVGATVEASASFTDAGTLDTHTSTWEWGDGSPTDGLVNEENGSGTTVGSYAYSVPGVYTLAAAVEDDDGGWDEEIYQYVVIYDSSGGFVTGGGWFDSPAGAYAPDGSLTGTATFGFVSKYKKGADVPTGVTEFHFKVASLKFHSSSYDWLVVAGKKAMFKGLGTINGEGNYGFMLSCIDGDLQGGDGIDRFRIKIWDRDTEAMVYDNQMGEVDDAEPATALGGGSIVIHKAK